MRYLLGKHFGAQDLDDHITNIYIATVEAILKGNLKQPEFVRAYCGKLTMNYICRVSSRKIYERKRFLELDAAAECFEEWRDARRSISPETLVIEQERDDVVQTALGVLTEKQRAVLTRFYVLNESKDDIKAALSLTENQFRLIKWRAKQRFGEAGKRALKPQLLILRGRRAA
jgi:RNA polymerase sigma-70 factor, ECF subfamily